jgi:PAS domain S-box-containing protein
MAAVGSEIEGPSISPVAGSVEEPTGQGARHDHFAQFYLDDQVLVNAVAEYVRHGLGQGAAAVVIATDAHLRALRERWQQWNFDFAQMCAGERLLMLDAAETLALFMEKDSPNRERFFDRVGGLIDQAAQGGRPVIAFGEMVALLWREGRIQAALDLEGLWNELARQRAFTLFCAYPLQECGSEKHIQPFEAVCASHTRVIPAEGGVTASYEEQAALIAQLQQKAFVLERKLAEEAETQRSIAHLAAIVESSDDAIVSKSLEGVIQSWNGAAQRMFGWSAEEAIGRPLTLIIPPERLDEERQILEMLRRGERIDHFETTRVAKDGRLVEVALSVSPIRSADGVIVGASKIARDITARKRAEQLLREHEQALRATNAELQSRTTELARFNQAAVGRELRIIELKEQVNALHAQLGENPKYLLDFEAQRQPLGPL